MEKSDTRTRWSMNTIVADDAQRAALALARMSRSQRRIFLAIRREGRTYAAIARETGLDPGQVESEFAAAMLVLDEAFRTGGPNTAPNC